MVTNFCANNFKSLLNYENNSYLPTIYGGIDILHKTVTYPGITFLIEISWKVIAEETKSDLQ